jgi:hypothetical protein
MENVRISNKSDLLSVFHKTTSSINRFNAINRSSAGSHLLRAASNRVSLIITDANISSVTNEGAISFFADNENVVSILKGAIQSVGMGNSLESLGKSLLGLINKQLSFVLLVIVISLLVAVIIDIL